MTMTMPGDRPRHQEWSALAPVPAGLSGARALIRRSAVVRSAGGDSASIEADRRALTAMLGGRQWAALEWPELLDGLTALGRTDIPFARLAEGHIDALRILRQAGRDPVPGALYGVWASRSGGGGLSATEEIGEWRLSGSVPFASGSGLLDRALVTAALQPPTPQRARPAEPSPAAPEAPKPAAAQPIQLLLDVSVRDWSPDPASWPTTAMAASRSFTVEVPDRSVPADAQVGPPDFYLGRPGFFPGGVGVAAVWAGGGARVADLVACFICASPKDPDQTTRNQLGRLSIEVAAANSLVVFGGLRLAGLHAAVSQDRNALQRLSTEVRAGVGAAVRRLLEIARGLAGPAGLGHDGELSSAIADLDLYVRQQHSDRDAEYLGLP